MNRIYLDNQSTTQLDPKVLETMVPWFTEKFGNASSITHEYGWEAKEGTSIARETIAKIINANTSEIIFTSGATESINLALQGIAKYQNNPKNNILTLATEHKSVIDTCKKLSKSGLNITFLPVKNNGFPNLKKFENAINNNTILVSILHANNEIGVIQPLEKMGEICKNKNVLFHVDAAQSFTKIPIDVNKMNIDLLSISAHKIYGPKGIGALYIRNKTPKINLDPILAGGGHENGLRPGTLPVPLVIGFGKASKIAVDTMKIETDRLSKLRHQLLQGLKNNINDIIVNGDINSRLPGNLNISIPAINGKALIMSLSSISISNGSACTSSITKPSHVLTALGLTKELAYSSIRFGIGRFNTSADIETAINLVSKNVEKLRNINYKIDRISKGNRIAI